jgi:hypothetical protein
MWGAGGVVGEVKEFKDPGSFMPLPASSIKTFGFSRFLTYIHTRLIKTKQRLWQQEQALK